MKLYRAIESESNDGTALLSLDCENVTFEQVVARINVIRRERNERILDSFVNPTTATIHEPDAITIELYRKNVQKHGLPDDIVELRVNDFIFARREEARVFAEDMVRMFEELDMNLVRQLYYMPYVSHDPVDVYYHLHMFGTEFVIVD
jgi:hypothetical protein